MIKSSLRVSLPRSNICSNKMTDQCVTHPWVIWHNIVIVQTLTQFPGHQLPPEPGVWCLVSWWSQWFNLPAVTRGSQLALLWMLMSVFRDMQRHAGHETLQRAGTDSHRLTPRAWAGHTSWDSSGSDVCPPGRETVHHGDTETKAIQSQSQSCPACVQSDQAQIMDGTSWIRRQVIGCNGYIGVLDMIYKYKSNGQSLRWHWEKVHKHLSHNT